MTSVLKNYYKLSEFLWDHHVEKGLEEYKNKITTHTRIPDKKNPETKIYGGNYHIPDNELEVFYKLYYNEVFVKKNQEYLTEAQRRIENNEGCGPYLIDFDFRYNYEIDTRQHTKEHIVDMLYGTYLDELKKYYVFDENTKFDIYVFEKDKVNRIEEDQITKDGIHIIIALQVDHIVQQIIRQKVIESIGDIWGDLKEVLTNDWDSVFDGGINTGKTNWQLYGSRKPGFDVYKLVYHFEYTYDTTDGEYMREEKDVTKFNLEKDYVKLTARYTEHPKFPLNPNKEEEYNVFKECGIRKNLSGAGGFGLLNNLNMNRKREFRIRLRNNIEDDENNEIQLEDITCKEILEEAVEKMLKTVETSNHDIKDTHYYTQILPEMFYEPGSHLLNRQVAFALKHTDERLFLSWVMLRSNASDFDYSTIPELYKSWLRDFNKNSSRECVTKRSIIYWAKQYAFDEYEKIKESSVDAFLEFTLKEPTDFDFAQVLYLMFKDKYVCSSVESKTWYIFNNHRWEEDKGMSLRMRISKEMYALYNKKIDQKVEFLSHNDNLNEEDATEKEKADKARKAIETISKLVVSKLKNTCNKNNIMREACEIFFDKDFIKKTDTNEHLMCFNNGVFDFKYKVFREGNPLDYITKTTGIEYIPFEKIQEKTPKKIEEVLKFMDKLFPIKTLNTYMWQHLASCLIGIDPNQTFNIYLGGGSNGKSVLTDFMSVCLGEYKGTVPITLITEKRGAIGGTSSELMQLKGVRYAVMQEPEKGMRINEGIMKELTGGDPLQGRALYSESETFKPQFKLVVCTNTLFEINSNDDGTWRRIRICDFMSKFVDNAENYKKIYKDEIDPMFVFEKDNELKNKFSEMAPVFMSMLVKMAVETNGIVTDCDIVLSASKKYRHGQDCISAFVNENIKKTGDKIDKVKKKELSHEFQLWFQREHGSRKAPKSQELYEYIDKKFGPQKSCSWSGIKIYKPEDEEEMDGNE
jgi:P4 family phage/plasmid primase-like protien